MPRTVIPAEAGIQIPRVCRFSLARVRGLDSLEEVNQMQLTVSDTAMAHIQQKGGRAVVDLVCISS